MRLHDVSCKAELAPKQQVKMPKVTLPMLSKLELRTQQTDESSCAALQKQLVQLYPVICYKHQHTGELMMVEIGSKDPTSLRGGGDLCRAHMTNFWKPSEVPVRQLQLHTDCTSTQSVLTCALGWATLFGFCLAILASCHPVTCHDHSTAINLLWIPCWNLYGR